MPQLECLDLGALTEVPQLSTSLVDESVDELILSIEVGGAAILLKP